MLRAETGYKFAHCNFIALIAASRPGDRREYRAKSIRFSFHSPRMLLLLSSVLCLALSGCIADVVNRSDLQTLAASANSVNLGNVTVGTTVSASVSLVNSNSVPVKISQVSFTGQSFSIAGQTSLPVSVAAGGTYNLNFNFDPAAVGPATSQMTITSDASTKATLISLSGTGVAEAQSPVQLSAVSCSSASMTGSGTNACTVTISGAAPVGGFNVSLSSNNAAVSAPATVTVKASATTAQFTANVLPVSSTQAVKLSASAGNLTTSFALELNAAISTLSISATSVTFGNVAVNEPVTHSVTMKSTGTAPVTISAATITGAGFTIAQNTFPISLSPGQTVTLGVQFDPAAAGAAAGQLTVTSNSSTNSSAAISLSGTGEAEAQTAVQLSAIICSSASITGSGTDVCTLTITSSAPGGGLNVNVSSNNTSVQVPAVVTVPANATTVQFTATISSVPTPQSATLLALLNGVSERIVLQLNAYTPILTISTTTVAFGDAPLNAALTQSVTITSNGKAPLMISAARLTGAEFTVNGAVFPLTLGPAQTVTLSVKFNPTIAGAAIGQLSITSNSSTGTTTLVQLSGTGTAGQHTVQLSPGQDIQSAVNAAPTGTTFLLLPGVYRMQSVQPKNYDTFIGQPGVIFNGSELLSFQSSGSNNNLWVAKAVASPPDSGECQSNYPMCIYDQDLFIDGQLQTPASVLAGLQPGSWYFDRANNNVYIPTDPAEHSIELGMTQFAFCCYAIGVEIEDIVVQEYATPAQWGAITGANNWTVDHVVSQWNHGAGIDVWTGSIENSSSLHNGQIGVKILSGIDSSVISNEIAWNNYAGYETSWEAGGSKFWNTTNLLVQSNYVHDNNGPGLWTDNNNVGTVYEYNTVENNAAAGIQHEISYNAIIANNIVTGNANNPGSSIWNSQILVANSQNVQVYGNTVQVSSGGGDGIGILNEQRGTGSLGVWVAANNSVSNNTVTYLGANGTSGLLDYLGGNTAVGNSFDKDRYILPAGGTQHWIWFTEMTWTQFQNAGQETSGTCCN